MEDVSVVDLSAETLSSPTIVDVIDLTKDSPRSLRPLRSRQRNAGVSSSHNTTVNLDNHHNNHNHKRHLSPMVLGSMLDNQMRHLKKKAKVSHSTSSNEILTLDDTVDEDKNTCYTVELDNKEAVALTCPICFESLSSNLKPITTRCGHLFCSECLQTFFRTTKKCPTCKTSITLKSCTRLYL